MKNKDQLFKYTPPKPKGVDVSEFNRRFYVGENWNVGGEDFECFKGESGELEIDVEKQIFYFRTKNNSFGSDKITKIKFVENVGDLDDGVEITTKTQVYYFKKYN